MKRYFTFLRVYDWLHILGLTILGYVFAARERIILSQLLLSLLIGALYLAYGYSLNECFDNIFDNKLKIRKDNFISLRKAIFLSYTILAINLILSSLYSWQMILLVLFGGIIGLLYSVPPIRLKQIPFLGLLCNSLCFTPLFLIGYTTVKNLDLSAYLMAIFIFLLFLPIDLIHQLNDFYEDRIKNIHTTAIAYGIKKILILTTISLIILNLWTLILYWYQRVSYSFFFLTLFFSIWLIIYLFRRFIKYGNDITNYKIKLKIRYLLMAYGIVVFIIFYFNL